MQVINSLDNIPDDYNSAVIALGNFDGVHKGHKAVISKAYTIAKELGAKSAVVTFEPHPIAVLRSDQQNFRLTSIQQKADLIEDLGVDYLIVLNFDLDFAKISAQEFIEQLLLVNLCAQHLVIGYDFIFGYKRSGNAKLIRKISEDIGFGFTQVEVVGDDETFSSTKIREFIGAGKLDKAREFLGRNFAIAGKVIKGDNRGAEIGFATANIDLGDYIRPAFGVYAVKAYCSGKSFDGVANIGKKPTFGENKEGLEVHIFDFDEDLYDKDIQVELIEFIRPEKKFSNKDELVAKIKQDCEEARKILCKC